MARTLLLNDEWDLTLTAAGRIAVTPDARTPAYQGDAYAVAQNVANAVRLFTRDAYFNQTRGLPHYNIELGRMPPESLLKSRIRKAALAVDGVSEAVVTFESLNNRVLRGDVRLTLTNGETADVAL